MVDPEQIAAVRDFNRFYTSRLGMTRNGLHKTKHPLAEARVLYELGTRGVLETSALRDALAIDAGQLSRLVTTTRRARTREPATVPTRRAPPAGRAHADGMQALRPRLDEGSREEIAELLEALPDREAAIAAMHHLRSAIEGERSFTIRGREPGDLGWLVERHGVLYAREYGWDESFERLVASIVAQFDPAKDRAWIAEIDGKRAGAVLCVHDTPDTRQAPHAAGRAARARPGPRQASSSTRSSATPGAAATGPSRCGPTTSSTPPAVSTSAPASRSRAKRRTTRSATTSIEQTWSLTLQPWTETH